MGAMFIQTPNGAERVGGGGGGVNVTASVGQTIVVKEVDSNGKPTKWEAADYQPRTHWSEETVVLEETTIVPDADGTLMFSPLDVPSVGATCKVTHNGTEYECKAADGSAMTGAPGAVILGNIDLVTGMGDTGEPFFIMIVAAGEGGAQLIPMDESVQDSDTFVLSIKSEVVAKLPAKYIPDEVAAYAPYYMDMFMVIDDAGNPVLRTLTTVAALEAMIDAGRTVIARVPSVNFGTYYLQFCNDMTGADGKRRMGFYGAGKQLQLTPHDDGAYIGETDST